MSLAVPAPTGWGAAPRPAWAAAASGALAAAAGLLATELASRSLDAPSVLRATGATVIDRAPEAGRRWAILHLGASDKPALLAAIAVVVVLVGAGVGLLARRDLRLAVAAVVAVAGAVLVAAASRPQTSAPGAAVAAAALAGPWAALLLLLSRRARPQPRGQGHGQDLDRRAFLGLAAGAALAGTVASTLLARAGGTATAMLARATVVLPKARRPLGAAPRGSEFDVTGLTPLTTPNGSFYRIDTALAVPAVAPDDWRLRVDGAVSRPLELSYDELLGLPMQEADVTLVCVSNEVGGSLVSSARWLGVPLGDVLARVRPTGRAEQLVGWSVDGFSAGFPVAYALERGALLAVGMNGEPLPLEHGFPARLVVPGLYGYASATKWLNRIELRPAGFEPYWVSRGYAADGRIAVQSRIDVPRPGATVHAGRVTVAGVAWAPHTGVARVQARVDAGAWVDATLAASAGRDVWRQWQLDWVAAPGVHQLQVKATDGAGRTQRTDFTRPIPSAATGAHTTTVTVR